MVLARRENKEASTNSSSKKIEPPEGTSQSATLPFGGPIDHASAGGDAHRSELRLDLGGRVAGDFHSDADFYDHRCGPSHCVSSI